MADGMFESKHVLIVSALVSVVTCQIFSTKVPSQDPQLRDIRKRWGAADVVRDMEHIKHDIKEITKLQDTGEISTNEALFYFLRMHDFDDNRKLDGHELIAAMRHSFDHGHDDDYVSQPMPFEEIEGVVDSFFAYDDNSDGFVSYPELRRHLSPGGTHGEFNMP